MAVFIEADSLRSGAWIETRIMERDEFYKKIRSAQERGLKRTKLYAMLSPKVIRSAQERGLKRKITVRDEQHLRFAPLRSVD